MKLYSGDLSPYSAKVRMQIYAMGIDNIEFELPASFYLGQLADISPLGRIPVLEVDDGIIPESEVIAEYLDDLYPQQSLAGKTARQRADVRLLSRIADIYLMNNIFMALPQIPRGTRASVTTGTGFEPTNMLQKCSRKWIEVCRPALMARSAK